MVLTILKENSIFDQILDSIETILPSIQNFLSNSKIFKFLKKNKNIIKMIIMILLAFRVVYRIQFLKITEEAVNLNFKLIGMVFNILLVFYSILKPPKHDCSKCQN